MDDGTFLVRSWTIALDGTVQDALPANPRRIGVMICPPPAFGQVVAFVVIPNGGQTQIVLPAGGTFECLYKNWGPLPGFAWKVQASAMGNTVYFIELLLGEE